MANFVTTNSTNNEIEALVEKIKTTVPVLKIILFGSYAEGNADEGSDIDLCVITADKRRKVELIREIQNALYDVATRPIDVLVYRPDEFEDRSDSIATIEKTIAKEGVVLYG